MTHSTTQAADPLKSGAWRKLVAPYMSPDNARSLWQIANTLIPYFAFYYLMYRSLSVSYWLTLALALPTAGFMVRTFIIMHDCGHGSFFKDARYNHFVGTLCGILTQTPYFQWTHEHAIHHATSGDLDRRGVGDVATLTVNEYNALSKFERLKYRLYRNPLVTFGVGPHYIFVFCSRFAGKTSGRRERRGVYLTNVALLALWGSAIWALGLTTFLMIYVPVQLIAGATGVWMFYVQHQYEDTYWQRKPEWDYATAALMGSSYYKLPRWMHWITGNIGYHHIHHLAPKIPNYKLRACHDATPLFQQAPTLTFWRSLRCANLKLWDEEQQRLITFGEWKRRQPVEMVTDEDAVGSAA
jgi:omega-6 fatty acid desaturase (delta-12 desaturase)